MAMADEKPLQGIAGETKITECPECGSEDIIFHDNERYCQRCGLVIE